MATLYEDALRRVQEAGDKLTRLHADPAVTLGQLTTALSDYRRSCTSAVHADYLRACTHKIEFDLWEAHSKINGLFRKHMHALKKRGRHNAVEIRKETKVYLEFLKSSQKFYRNFIGELNDYHGGVSELQKIAGILEPRQVKPKADAVSARTEVQKRLVQSCYNNLIHLGDLSRYRETECSSSAPNWGPAKGYYELATGIYPSSGVSHNQLAVMALHDQGHLRSTYHFYRAITVSEPHPQGQTNLELEFKKITTAWDKGELIKIARSGARDVSGSTKALCAWFVRLHSKCYLGQAFSSHDELEGEVLGQMKTAILDPERDHAALINKLVLINISAEWLAKMKIEGGDPSDQNLKSFYYYIQLNARTFTLLLELLSEELERPPPADCIVFELTTTARRIMPAIRLYSSWMARNAQVLSAELGDAAVMTRLKDMWRVYATLLTRAAPLVSGKDVPILDYMLEEDVDTIGYLPLYEESEGDPYAIWNRHKLRYGDQGVERHLPVVEALARLRDFVISGTQAISDPHKGIPIVYSDWRFTFSGEVELESGRPVIKTTPQTLPVPAPLGPASTRPSVPQPHKVPQDGFPKRSNSNSTTASRDAMMNRMVDALVGDDGLDALPEEDEGPVTPPMHASTGSPMIRNLSNSIGNLTTSEVINQMPSQSSSWKSSTLNANASVFVHSGMPSPQEEPLTRPALASHPSTPQAAGGSHHTSPLAYTPELSTVWHSRHPSDQTPLPAPQPIPLSASSARQGTAGATLTPTMPSAFGTLGNVWGISSTVPTAEWVRQKQPRYQDSLTSSALFGKQDSRWDSFNAAPTPPKVATPANGQGG